MKTRWRPNLHTYLYNRQPAYYKNLLNRSKTIRQAFPHQLECNVSTVDLLLRMPCAGRRAKMSHPEHWAERAQVTYMEFWMSALKLGVKNLERASSVDDVKVEENGAGAAGRRAAPWHAAALLDTLEALRKIGAMYFSLQMMAKTGVVDELRSLSSHKASSMLHAADCTGLLAGTSASGAVWILREALSQKGGRV